MWPGWGIICKGPGDGEGVGGLGLAKHLSICIIAMQLQVQLSSVRDLSKIRGVLSQGQSHSGALLSGEEIKFIASPT